MERQTEKNSSVNKVYDSTNLLLHKWNLLERFPILLLARRTSQGFSAECFCPWQMDTEETKDAFVTIKRLYESLLNVAVSDEPATNSTQTEEPLENSSDIPADPVLESTPLLTCSVAVSDEPATNSTQTEEPLENSSDIPADPVLESTPLLTCSVAIADEPSCSTAEDAESTPLLTPESETPMSSSLASPVSSSFHSTQISVGSCTTSLTPPVSSSVASSLSLLTHPVFISSQSTPMSPSLTSASSSAPNLSTSSKNLASSSSKRKRTRRKADSSECPLHKDLNSFPYKKILKKRIREGHAEVLVQWFPCSGCGAKWKNSWEPKENIQN